MLTFISFLITLCVFAGADARSYRYHNASEMTVSGNLTITRGKVMDCVRQWIKEKIPYCQCSGGPPSECCGHCPFCGSTRCDCSGFVSNCWGLKKGYTTGTMHEIAHPISKDELKHGDILLYAADHVVFFGGWQSSARTHYTCYQEPGCHTAGPHYAYSSIVPYPFNWNPSAFLPYRYDHIVD